MVMDFDPGFSFNVQGGGDAAHPWEFRGATHISPYHRNLQHREFLLILVQQLLRAARQAGGSVASSICPAVDRTCDTSWPPTVCQSI